MMTTSCIACVLVSSTLLDMGRCSIDFIIDSSEQLFLSVNILIICNYLEFFYNTSVFVIILHCLIASILTPTFLTIYI